ncbi:MAG: SocA family protein [Armatimonadetes bacterium]|nr:SocA family protein [Armatimonadota bacterium]
MKLMYLVERRSLEERGLLFTGGRLINMDRGPLVSEVYDCIKRETNEHMSDGLGSLWNRYLSPITDDKIFALNALDPGKALTEEEIGYVDAVWNEFGALSEDELGKFMHGLPEWSDPKGSSHWIKVDDVLAGFGLPDDQVQARVDRIRHLQHLEAFFTSSV